FDGIGERLSGVDCGERFTQCDDPTAELLPPPLFLRKGISHSGREDNSHVTVVLLQLRKLFSKVVLVAEPQVATGMQDRVRIDVEREQEQPLLLFRRELRLLHKSESLFHRKLARAGSGVLLELPAELLLRHQDDDVLCTHAGSNTGANGIE